MARGEIARLFVTIGADVREATRAVESVRGQLGQLQRDSRRSADAWAGFTGTLARTGLAIQGIRQIASTIEDIAGGIGSLALAADTQATSMSRLTSSITNTGRAIDDGLRQKLDDTISSMESTTLFTDNDLRQALQNLVIGTGDVDEALSRLPIAADLAAREQIELATAGRMLGRIDENTLQVLGKYGLGLDKNAEKSGEFAAAQMLAAKAGISVSGAMKAVGNESIRKRWGIPDPKDVKGAINEAALLAEAQKALAGGATGAAAGLAGGWSQVGKEFSHLKEQLGEFMLPIAKGAVAFLSKSIGGVRRLIQLFSTDISGPRIGGVRKLWQTIFGTEMPAALQAVVGGFTDVGKRIEEFVKSINSTDDATVRGAIKALFEGLKTDIGKALGGIGEEFDKMGLGGLAIKLFATAIVVDKTLPGGLNLAGSIFELVKDALTIGWLTVALLGSGPAIAVAAGVFLGLTISNEIDQAIKGNGGNVAAAVYDKVKDYLKAAGLAVAVAGAIIGAPIVIAVGVGVLLGLAAVEFDKQTGGGFGKIAESVKTAIWNWIKGNIPMPGAVWQFLESGIKLLIPFTVQLAAGDRPAKIDLPNANEREDRGGGGGGSQDRPATLDDIVAAYARVTGGVVISDAYARAVLDQGFSVEQALRENIFTGTVPGARTRFGGAFAMGGSGVVTRPTMFIAGDRGAEQYKFSPVGSGGGGGAGGTVIAPVFHIGSVDSRERVTELGNEFQVRAARLLGLAV